MRNCHPECCPYLLCAHPKCCGYRLQSTNTRTESTDTVEPETPVSGGRLVATFLPEHADGLATLLDRLDLEPDSTMLAFLTEIQTRTAAGETVPVHTLPKRSEFTLQN